MFFKKNTYHLASEQKKKLLKFKKNIIILNSTSEKLKLAYMLKYKNYKKINKFSKLYTKFKYYMWNKLKKLNYLKRFKKLNKFTINFKRFIKFNNKRYNKLTLLKSKNRLTDLNKPTNHYIKMSKNNKNTIYIRFISYKYKKNIAKANSKGSYKFFKKNYLNKYIKLNNNSITYTPNKGGYVYRLGKLKFKIKNYNLKIFRLNYIKTFTQVNNCSRLGREFFFLKKSNNAIYKILKYFFYKFISKKYNNLNFKNILKYRYIFDILENNILKDILNYSKNFNTDYNLSTLSFSKPQYLFNNLLKVIYNCLFRINFIKFNKYFFFKKAIINLKFRNNIFKKKLKKKLTKSKFISKKLFIKTLTLYFSNKVNIFKLLKYSLNIKLCLSLMKINLPIIKKLVIKLFKQQQISAYKFDTLKFYVSYYNIYKFFNISKKKKWLKLKKKRRKKRFKKKLLKKLNIRKIKSLFFYKLLFVILRNKKKKKILKKRRLRKFTINKIKKLKNPKWKGRFRLKNCVIFKSKKKVINYINLNILQNITKKNPYNYLFLNKYTVNDFYVKFYLKTKKLNNSYEDSSVKGRVNRNNKSYIFNIWKKKIATYKKARIIHWNVYKIGTIKKKRYKKFLFLFLRKMQLEYKKILNIFIIKFNLSYIFWKNFIDMYLLFFNKNVNKKSIYQFPINIDFWFILKQFNIKSSKIQKKILRWIYVKRRVNRTFWMKKKKNIPSVLSKHIVFNKSTFSTIQYDFITNYFSVIKLKQDIILNEFIHTNKLLKLHNFRYKS